MLEREVKLMADAEFAVPDLGGVVDGVQASPVEEKVLDATYYDTDDLRLLRAGVTVRYRSAGDSGEWTVKFPEAGTDESAALRRDEIDTVGPADAMPDGLLALVVGLTRTAPLVPVARLVTRRRRHVLRGEDGSTLLEVDDDEVTVLDGDDVVTMFREVEAEVAAAAPEALLGAVVERLHDAGARTTTDPVPKVARALGTRAEAPPDLQPVRVGRNPTAADVIRAGITASVLRLVAHHHVVRLDGDTEGVHQARVATRRLRSDLRTFRPLLDQEWSESLRDELRWLADLLGAVRDLDVLGARLRERVDVLPAADRAAASQFLDRLDGERAIAFGGLLAAMDEPRYASLLDRLVDATRAPQIVDGAGSPARKVVPPLARRPWRKLRKAVRALGARPSDAALHAVRIRAKRARYAADVAAPVSGKAARRFASGVADLQDVLGDQHDAVLAEAWLRDAAPSVSPAAALTMGQLVALERMEADRLRTAWRPVWKRVSRRKAVAWLS